MKIYATLVLATLALSSVAADQANAPLTREQAVVVQKGLFHPHAKQHHGAHRAPTTKSHAKYTDAKKSVAKQVNVAKPQVKHVSDVNKPAVKKAEAKKPVAKTSAVKKPMVKHVNAKRPIAKTAEAKKLAVKKPVVKMADAMKPVAKKPEGKKPEVRLVDANKPVVRLAEVKKPVVKMVTEKKPMAPSVAKPLMKKAGPEVNVKKQVVHMRKPTAPSFKVALKKLLPPVLKPRLQASDLNEGEGFDDILGDPFGGQFGTQGFDDEPTEPPHASDSSLGDSGSGNGESDGWDGSSSGVGESDGWDGSSSGVGESDGWDGSSSGVGESDGWDGSSDGSNESSTLDGSGGSLASSTDGDATASRPNYEHGGDYGHGEDGGAEWTFFDGVDSGSGYGSDESESGSALGSQRGDDEGSGSGPVGKVQGVDVDLDILVWTDSLKHHEKGAHAKMEVRKEVHTKNAAETKKMATEAEAAKEAAAERTGAELASRLSADSTSFGIEQPKSMLLVGSIAGAVIGALAVVLGVVHLRRQQSETTESTLSAELPEPRTGREEAFEDADTVGGEDALASSSVDLEEALNKDAGNDDSESDSEEVEGTFANDPNVV